MQADGLTSEPFTRSQRQRHASPMALLFTRIAFATIAAAWLLFVLFLVLPATNCPAVADHPLGAAVTGWQAFIDSLLSVALHPLLWLAEPRFLLILILPFSHGLMLLAPAIILRDREKSAVIALVLAPSAFVPWLLPQPLSEELFAGLYCWIASYFLMTLGCVLELLALAIADQERQAIQR